MPLPEPILDDLRFQRDLVDEAKRRIIRYCPEWTDYNVSDPGVTLIELFAWMTELITYRLNLVPEKNHIKFMELLGVQLQPANSARAELTFRLAAPLPITPGDETTAIVPAGQQVATRLTDEEPEVIFTTDARLVIAPPVLAQVRRDEEFNKNYLPRFGVELFYAFRRPRPEPGDTFYLGLDEGADLSGHILQLDFDCEETQATGVRRTDPPLVWEVSIGDGQWAEVAPSTYPGEQDTTGGLNNAHGQITFYLPLNVRADQVQGRTAAWLRCRLEQRRPEQGMYSQPPRIIRVTAYSLGATTRATHAVLVYDELLGTSDGEPGQAFRVQNAPVLTLREGEAVTVQEKREGELVPVEWTLVNDFSGSDRYDRHFALDNATGEVAFGPAIRQPDGSVRQYGRIPEVGREVRLTRYRYGGGVAGNVPAGKLTVLKSTIPYIDSVTNLRRAQGGRDQETLDEAKMRARREVRAQQRAVTADDYAGLAKGASRAVARARCLAPGKQGTAAAANLPAGTVEVMVVPAVADALRHGDLSKLALEAPLAQAVSRHLDQYRLLTTTVRVREPSYLGVRVIAEVVVSEYSQPEAVLARVKDAVRGFLSPLKLSPPEAPPDELMGPGWEGWPFGRALFVSELFSLIQRVPGVKHVLDVQVAHRPVNPAAEAPPAEEPVPGQAADTTPGPEVARLEAPLTPLAGRHLEVGPDTLLCALEPVVKLVEL